MRDADYLKRMKLLDSWYNKISIPNEFKDSTFLQEILSIDGVEHNERTEMYIYSVYANIKDIDAYTSNIRTFKKVIDNRILCKMIDESCEVGTSLHYSSLDRFSICKNGTVDIHRRQLWFNSFSIINVQFIIMTTALKNHFDGEHIVVLTDNDAYVLHINDNMITDKEKIEDRYVDKVTIDKIIEDNGIYIRL